MYIDLGSTKPYRIIENGEWMVHVTQDSTVHVQCTLYSCE